MRGVGIGANVMRAYMQIISKGEIFASFRMIGAYR